MLSSIKYQGKKKRGRNRREKGGGMEVTNNIKLEEWGNLKISALLICDKVLQVGQDICLKVKL